MRKLVAFSILLGSTFAFAGGGKSDPQGESRKDPSRGRMSLEQMRAELIRYKQEKTRYKHDLALGRLFKDRDHNQAFEDLREAQITDTNSAAGSTHEPQAVDATPATKLTIRLRDVVSSAPKHSRESFAIVRLLKVWMAPKRSTLDQTKHDLVFAVFRTRTLDKDVFDGLNPEQPTPASMAAATRMLVAMDLFLNTLTGRRVGPSLSAVNALTDFRLLANSVQAQDPATARFIDDVLLLITEPTRR